MRTDAHFTPDWLAAFLVSHVETRSVSTVLDLAAGNGALLNMARRRWPTARLVGVDKRGAAVAHLRKHLRGNSTYLKADTLRAHGRDFLTLMRTRRIRADVVLLNPPFSIRGGATREVATHPAGSLRTSVAGAFFAVACQSVRVGGVVCAVMPRAFLRAARDLALLYWLDSIGSIKVIDYVRSCAFAHVRANTVVVLFKRERIRPSVTAVTPPHEADGEALVTRGNVRVAEVPARVGEMQRWVHTTHLRSGTVERAITRVPARARLFRGPCVIIPRVGNAPGAKIAVYTSRVPFAASDCVLVYDCPSARHAEVVAASLRRRWSEGGDSELEGTGAKYLTIQQTSEIIREILGSRHSASFTSSPLRLSHG